MIRIIRWRWVAVLFALFSVVLYLNHASLVSEPPSSESAKLAVQALEKKRLSEAQFLVDIARAETIIAEQHHKLALFEVRFHKLTDEEHKLVHGMGLHSLDALAFEKRAGDMESVIRQYRLQLDRLSAQLELVKRQFLSVFERRDKA